MSRIAWFLLFSLTAGLLAGCGADVDVFRPNRTMTAVFATQGPPTLPPPQPPTSTLPPLPAATLPPPTAAVTPPPAPSPLPPSAVQGRALVVASFRSSPLTLDGNWEEWTGRENACQIVIEGKQEWRDKNDLRASFRSAWDFQYLYLAVKVHDDAYAPNQAPEQMDQGDGVQILLDTDLAGDFGRDQLNHDDYILGVSAGSSQVGENPAAYLWQPRNLAGAQAQVRVAAQRILSDQDRGYYVEIAVPWELAAFKPQGGSLLGFALLVSDGDDSNRPQLQSRIANVPGVNRYDPTTWIDLELERP